jgi:hypothetical protein
MNLAGYPVEYEGAEKMNSLKHLGLPIMAAGEKHGDTIAEHAMGSLRTIYLRENQLVGFQLVGDIRCGRAACLNEPKKRRELHAAPPARPQLR